MHIFNGILTGTYTRPAQQCHYEWAWVSLSNLAKHSITRSVARFLCGSWACCFCLLYVRPSVRPFGVSTVPSVRPSVAELANMIHVFWKQMKRLCCKFAEVVGDQLWGSRGHMTQSHDASFRHKKTLLSIFHYHTKFNKTWQAHNY